MPLRAPLTGPPNRSLLMERLKECIDEAARLCDPLAVMLVGLDRFKDINDSLGHDFGAQLQILKDRRCEIGQGYYFHRPLSSTAFECLLVETAQAVH